MNLPPIESSYRTLTLGVTGLVVKATPGAIIHILGQNINAAIRYLKVYNKATAAAETDTPILTIPLPASGAAVTWSLLQGFVFSAGISIRSTTGIADNDVGAPSASETIVHILYR
jgi:hypothetical protein